MRKSFLAAGALAALMTLYVLAVSPLEDERLLLKDRLEADYAKLVKYKGFITGAKVSKEELGEAKAALERLQKGTINEPQEPLAFAELQIRLQDAARQAGLVTMTIRPIPNQAVAASGFKSLPIYMEAEGGIMELSDFLRSIDYAGSYMRIDRLAVGPKDVREPKELRVRIQVSGLMRLQGI